MKFADLNKKSSDSEITEKITIYTYSAWPELNVKITNLLYRNRHIEFFVATLKKYKSPLLNITTNKMSFHICYIKYVA